MVVCHRSFVDYALSVRQGSMAAWLKSISESNHHPCQEYLPLNFHHFSALPRTVWVDRYFQDFTCIATSEKEAVAQPPGDPEDFFPTGGILSRDYPHDKDPRARSVDMASGNDLSSRPISRCRGRGWWLRTFLHRSYARGVSSKIVHLNYYSQTK